MTDTKWTHSPWDINIANPRIVVSENEGHHIATTTNADNATLIAAAPELYEALNLVGSSGKFQCFDDDAWQIVNNALDKASGEDQ